MLRTRLAPTPSGYLHVGNIYSFIITWLIAKSQGGSILLRIDDLDAQRIRNEYIDDIFEVLRFLNIDYDEGPVNTENFIELFSQQHRLSVYEDFLNKLVDTDKVYACNCSRKKTEPEKAACDCRNKNLPLDTPETSWRIHVLDNTIISFPDDYAKQVSIKLSTAMPDFVIRRKDKLPAYQVASLCDDLLYSINYIVRGLDLLPSTAAQLYLATLVNETSFLKTQFLHHPLINNSTGEKISKSAGSQSLHYLIKNGITQAEVLKLIQAMPGFSHNKDLVDIRDMFQDFSKETFLDQLKLFPSKPNL